ncbi:DUF1801 domain-containing protein [Ornithinibacillus sp. 4-3]|uniref:DUF1801 domain-containing protein n=1 Tax=Ornithinibacillus sp. 4-3 TaxID=3231488 RepID=A0AB39HIV1_9BACI
MQYNVNSAEEYLAELPEERKPVIEKLRQIILDNLPEGFQEEITYGMLNYVVPLETYPAGYHVNEGQALPFMALASQKNHIALYHMGIYAQKGLEEWFREEYAKQVPTKLDMGKSCIRFKNPKRIPYELIAELCQKITVDEYIKAYEAGRKRSGV